MKTFSITTRKNVAAVLLGPLLLVPVMVVTYLVLALLNGVSAELREVVGVSLLFSLWGLIIAYPATLVLGVPSVLLLKRYGKLNYFSVLASGLVWSIPIVLSLGVDVVSAILTCYCGAIVASGCWLVYKNV